MVWLGDGQQHRLRRDRSEAGSDLRAWTTTDTFFLLGLTVFCTWIRVWRIWHPNQVVFDEVYFGEFSNHYLRGEFYYDIHPPWAKLVAACVAHLLEYNAGIDFEHDGTYKQADFVSLRLTPAVVSSFCGPLVYVAVRTSGFSKMAAILGGGLTAVDTVLGTEGRHILSDGLLHFFAMLHVAVLCFSLRYGVWTGSWRVMHIVNGITLGLACSCKNTAWGLMVLAAWVYVIHLWRRPFVEWLVDIVIHGGGLAVTVAVTYTLVWWIHFIALPFDGPGTGYLIEAMKEQLMTRNSGAVWAQRLRGPSLWARAVWIAVDTHRGNMGITEFHDSMSFPRQWPVLHGIATFFWSGGADAEIRCVGNVFSHYFALVGLALCGVCARWRKWIGGTRFIVGWAACWLPFMLVPRVMYQYHYAVPFMLGTCAAGAAVDLLRGRSRGAVATVLIAAALFGFWLWSPFTYGTRMKDPAVAVWTEAWREGTAEHKSLRQSHWESEQRARGQ